MVELGLDLPDESSRRQEEESTHHLPQSEITRLHQAYSRQIDTLESIIQDKDLQLYQYQQTVTQQTTELANLREELAFLRSKDQRSNPERSALLSAMCEIKLDELFCRMKPSIVQVNLCIAKLVSLHQESEDLDVSFASAVEEEDTPESARSFLDTAKQDAARLHETGFQLSRREMDSDSHCTKCAQLRVKLDALNREIRKHKAFIETLKKTLESMLGSKTRRV